MKKVAVLLLFVCSVAFAQNEYGASASANASTGTESIVATETTPEPAKESKDAWHQEWEKRRHSVSFIVGWWPLTAWLNIFIHAASDEKRDPDMTAYSFAYGYEVYRLLELGLMVDYTTVADKSVISVVPRVKFNFINKKYFRMYIYAGAGAVFWDGGAFLMMNVSYLGFEFGNPISFFAECGGGQVGMLAAGLKFSF